MTRLQKTCALLLLCVCLSATAYAQTHLSGPQSGILTGTTYVVDSTIYVPAGDSLVIMPGATFLFRSNSFNVYGYLYAVGTEQDSITFRPLESDWGGIWLTTGSAGSQISYAIIKKTGNRVSLFNTSGIVISHCSILGGHVGGIDCQSVINLTITDCDIIANSIYGAPMSTAGGMHFSNCHPVHVSNCRIMNNVYTAYNTMTGSGGVLASGGTELTITNCLFRGNMSWMYSAALTVSSSSQAEVSNCTFVENAGTETAAINASNTTRIVNSIIRNDRISEFNGIGGVILYCDVQGGHPGTGNFDADPLFVTGPGGAYYLSQVAAGQPVNSPCVDAGAPAWPMVTGTTRTDGVQDAGIVDVGYHYPVAGTGLNEVGGAHAVVSVSEATPTMGVSPNPFNPTTAISYKLQATSQVRLTVWDTAGRLVTTLVDGKQEAGQHSVTFDGSRLASGLYFVQMQAGEYCSVQKMMLMK